MLSKIFQRLDRLDGIIVQNQVQPAVLSTTQLYTPVTTAPLAPAPFPTNDQFTSGEYGLSPRIISALNYYIQY